MNEKPQKCMCMSNVLAFFFQDREDLLKFVPQLDTVIIEVASVKGLSLRGNTLRPYRAKHLPINELALW